MAEPTLCMRINCGKPARWQVGFRLWLIGAPRTPEHANPALTTLCVCDDCKPLTKAEDFFPVETQVRIAHQFGAAGAPTLPDFASAQVEFTELVVGQPLSMRQMVEELPSGPVAGEPKGRMN